MIPPNTLVIEVQDRANNGRFRAMLPFSPNPDFIEEGVIACIIALSPSGTTLDKDYFRYRFNYWAVWRD